MQLDKVLQILKDHREKIADFGVTSLSVFGSVARNEAGPDSDIDILVEFSVPVGLFQFFRLQQFLEDRLGRKVDLVTLDGLRKSMREQVTKEAVRAA